MTLQRVRALITEPAPGQEAPAGELVVRGVAWSGAAPIAKVEVSVDGGDWREARLVGERKRHSWQWWELIARFERPGEVTPPRPRHRSRRPRPARARRVEQARLREQQHSRGDRTDRLTSDLTLATSQLPMDWISDPQAWIGLATLTVLEIVLGIDNVIFISILAGKLPREQQGRARYIGLAAGDVHADRAAVLAVAGSSGSPRRSSPCSARRSPAATWCS